MPAVVNAAPEYSSSAHQSTGIDVDAGDPWQCVVNIVVPGISSLAFSAGIRHSQASSTKLFKQCATAPDGWVYST